MDIFYLCNGKRCSNCNPEDCKHTSDLDFAKTGGKGAFHLIYGAFFEIDPIELKQKGGGDP